MTELTHGALAPRDRMSRMNSRHLERRLMHVQAVAGALFAVFVLLHLSNIALAPFGPEVFNQYQRVIRQVYQFPLIELLLVLGPLLVHAVVGVWLYLIRRGGRSERPLRARLHSWAGVFLLVFIFGHILAVRGPSYFFGVYPEFEGLHFSLWYFPHYFFPYYFLLTMAGFFHAGNGLRMIAARQGLHVSPATQLTVMMIAAAWIALSLMALGGLLFTLGNPADSEFAQLGASLFGLDPATPIF